MALDSEAVLAFVASWIYPTLESRVPVGQVGCRESHSPLWRLCNSLFFLPSLFSPHLFESLRPTDKWQSIILPLSLEQVSDHEGLVEQVKV